MITYDKNNGEAINRERRAERTEMRASGFKTMKAFRKYKKKLRRQERKLIKNS